MTGHGLDRARPKPSQSRHGRPGLRFSKARAASSQAKAGALGQSRAGTTLQDAEVEDLRKAIWDAGVRNKSTVLPQDLILYKVNIDLRAVDEDLLSSFEIENGYLSNLKTKNKRFEAERLKTMESISSHWPSPSVTPFLRVFVTIRYQDQRPLKRIRFSDSFDENLADGGKHTPSKPLAASKDTEPCTPPRTIPTEPMLQSPPRLGKESTEDKLAKAIEPFEQYIKYLAEGKLDAYLDAVRPTDKSQPSGIEKMLTGPNLLLHELGLHVDMNKINKLFCRGTVHLYNLSGSGKTRLSLEGLCHNWGLYVSCKKNHQDATGSLHFHHATQQVLPAMSIWDKKGAARLDLNAQALNRTGLMLMAGRLYTLCKFVRQLPPSTNAITARRRWVLIQAMPPRKNFHDIFVHLFKSIRGGEIVAMTEFIQSIVTDLYSERSDLFTPARMFLVLDEAQLATTSHADCFPSTSDADATRSLLHAVYKCFADLDIFHGIIVSGTGLSMDVIKGTLKSSAAKRTSGVYVYSIYLDTGSFLDKTCQESYIRRYLDLSDSVSDRFLLERILRWLKGRHRLTASFIEILLRFKNAPRHRCLTAYVHFLTRFTLTDAVHLEDKEDPLTDDIWKSIKNHKPLTSIESVMIGPKDENIQFIRALRGAVMQWVVGSMPSFAVVKKHMLSMIEHGVGHVKFVSDGSFDPDATYPAYIDEPCIVLYLGTLFEKYGSTERNEWLQSSVESADKKSSFGYILEVAGMMLLMEKFGGQFTALGDAFNFCTSSSLGSRMVTLVSLARMPDGTMSNSEASWNLGSSDRFGFKANSPTDVLAFFADPKGKCFLFPHNCMGPDVVCFLKDKKTSELIILLLQSRMKPTLDSKTWLKALQTVTPEFFYTMIKSGERTKYAPSSYPTLTEDLASLFQNILGTGDFRPVVEGIRSTLRSAKQEPGRQTPRFLRVIASPADKQEKRLYGEDVVTLKWDLVKDYVGPAANFATQRVDAIH